MPRVSLPAPGHQGKACEETTWQQLPEASFSVVLSSFGYWGSIPFWATALGKGDMVTQGDTRQLSGGHPPQHKPPATPPVSLYTVSSGFMIRKELTDWLKNNEE